MIQLEKFANTYNSWFIKENPSLLGGEQFLTAQAEIESRELARELEKFLSVVKKYKLDQLIQSNSFLIINKFLISELKKVSTVGLRTVSNLENSTFFFQNKHYKKIQESAVKQIQKYFPSERDEAVVTYLVERYIGFLKDSRTYHQSILLHYLTNYSPEELRLSKIELGWL